MEKKVTVRDVAREAGVSVATVSYIMNNRTDMKISEETRKKVLQIANLLNYRPSQAAKSLATGRNSMIGLAYRLNPDTPSRNLDLINFSNLLIERLNRLKLDVLFLPVSDTLVINRNIDGIIAIDLSHKDFALLSNNCFVPIINVDMLINDSLFYQIYSDMPVLIERAHERLGNDFAVVLEPYENEAYLEYITQNIPGENIILTSSFAETATKIKGRKVLIIGTCLALMLRSYISDSDMAVISCSEYEPPLPESVYVYQNDIAKKANLTINILLNALDRKFEVKHDHKIAPL